MHQALLSSEPSPQLFNSISNSPLLLVNTASVLNENLKESFKNVRGGGKWLSGERNSLPSLRTYG